MHYRHGMDTDSLRWFQQVADGITVTEVSALEHTSQSGISRALARLESEVGTPLLRRSGRTLRMTHAGVAFKHHVDVMMHHLDDGLAAVQQLIEPETGTVTLAFEPSLGFWLVPDLVGSFRAEHPDVQFDLRPKRHEPTTAVRTRGDVDLELSTLRPPRSGYHWWRVARDPLYLAVASSHPLAARSDVALAELSDLPFVALRPPSLLRRACDELLVGAGVEPTIAFECDDLPTMLGYVVAGLGVAIMPGARGHLAEPAGRAVHHLEITDRGAVREIGLAWPAEGRLLPAVERFRAHVVERASAGLLPPLRPLR